MSKSWKSIEGYSSYLIHKDGRVKSVDRVVVFSNGAKRLYKGKLLAQTYIQGYMRVSITHDDGPQAGKKRVWRVHRLVMLAHGPDKPSLGRGVQVDIRHKDGNTQNNNLKNLAWSSQWRNSQDRYRHGTVPYGEKANRNVLTEELVLKAKRLRKKGKSWHHIVDKLKVKSSTIQNAVAGITWPHLKDR